MRRRRSEIAPAIIQRPRSSTPLASSTRILEAAGQLAVAGVCGTAAGTTSGREDNAMVGDCSGRGGAAAGTACLADRQHQHDEQDRPPVREEGTRRLSSRQTSTTRAAADTTTAVWRPKSQRSRSQRLLVIASSPSCGRCRAGPTPRDGLPRAGAATSGRPAPLKTRFTNSRTISPDHLLLGPRRPVDVGAVLLRRREVALLLERLQVGHHRRVGDRRAASAAPRRRHGPSRASSCARRSSSARARGR